MRAGILPLYKSGEYSLSKHISYFKERTENPEFYQVHLANKDIGSAEINGQSLPLWKFCRIKNRT